MHLISYANLCQPILAWCFIRYPQTKSFYTFYILHQFIKNSNLRLQRWSQNSLWAIWALNWPHFVWKSTTGEFIDFELYRLAFLFTSTRLKHRQIQFKLKWRYPSALVCNRFSKFNLKKNDKTKNHFKYECFTNLQK